MQRLVDSFQKKVAAEVAKLFPSLVRQEMMKLLSSKNDRMITSDGKLTKKAQVLELHKRGMRNIDIATKLDMHASNVCNIIKSSDLKTSKPSANGQYAAALAKHGSQKAAAKALGIPRSTFGDRLAAERAA